MSRTQLLDTLVLHPDGTVEKVQVAPVHELQFMQRCVGGYIEAQYGWVGVDPETQNANVTLFSNEEAKIHNMPVNDLATALWWALDSRFVGVDHLRGVVVVTGGADQNGDTLPVPDKVVEMVERVGGA